MSAVAKRLLKSAKSELAAKNYEAAKDLCEQVLDFEASNYHALVYLGVIHKNLGNTGESEKAYRRAIEGEPTNPLAWQGLVNLFGDTQSYVNLAETLEVLKNVYRDTQDAQKYLDTINKLLDTYEKIGDRPKHIATLELLLPSERTHTACVDVATPSPVDIWKRIADLQERHDAEVESKAIAIRRNRLDAGTMEDIRRDAQREMIQGSHIDQAYEALIKLLVPAEDLDFYVSVLEKYTVFLYKKLTHVLSGEKGPLYEKLVHLAKEALEHGSRSPDIYLIVLDSFDVDIKDYDREFMSNLSERLPDASLGRLAQAYLAWKDASVPAVVGGTDDMLISVTKETPGLALAHGLLAEFFSLNGDLNAAIDSVIKAKAAAESFERDKGFTRRRVAASNDIALAKYYVSSGPKFYGDALELYKKVLQESAENVDALLGLGTLLNALKKPADAERCLRKVSGLIPDSIEALLELGWSCFLQEEFDEARTAFDKLTNSEAFSNWPNTHKSCAYYRFGRLEHASGNAPEALAHFLASAKSNPSYARPFTYLGHHYKLIEKDLSRARKCYVRALSLDPHEEEAAKGYLEIFDGDEAMLERVLEGVVSDGERRAWAWQGLGLLSLASHDYDTAVVRFQAALRIDSDLVICWEGLGEAYTAQGKYVAGCRAFRRGIELLERNAKSENTHLASLHYHLAGAHAKMAMWVESIHSYRTVLEITQREGKKHLPALKGLAEALIMQARARFDEGYSGQCATLLREAVNVSVAIFLSSVDNGIKSTFGKILGDAVIASVVLVPGACEAAVPSDVVAQLNAQKRNAPELMENDPIDAIVRCAISAGWAVLDGVRSLEEDDSGAWADLGLCYFVQYINWRKSNQNHKVTDAVKQVEQRMHQTVMKAITAEPTSASYWNLFGLITLRTKPRVSQHTFIRAMNIEGTKAGYWSNLAILFLEQQDRELSAHAFSQARVVDPEWPIGWVGVGALLNEPESLKVGLELGRGAWEYGLAAYDSINEQHLWDGELAARRVVEVEGRRCWWGVNLIGLFSEMAGRITEAIDCYDKALTSARDAAAEDATIQLLKENLARSLCSAGRYGESVQLWSEITGNDAYLWVGKGLALCFAGGVQEGLGCFERALAVSAASSESAGNGCTSYSDADMTLILARILYSLPLEQRSLAVQQLLRVATAAVPRSTTQQISALCAIMAYGCRSGDAQVAWSAASEVLRLGPDLTQEAVEAVFTVARTFGADTPAERKAARRVLCKTVHLRPSQGQGWTTLMKSLEANQWSVGVECGTAALVVERGMVKARHRAERESGIAKWYMIGGHKQEARRWALKAVHSWPTIGVKSF
ncbi:Superkiller protein 3 [Gaertneriomyces sp. JEL0708]|nr:Superkiller protein 3 [Gaertneriomyces sp. JEL0708]